MNLLFDSLLTLMVCTLALRRKNSWRKAFIKALALTIGLVAFLFASIYILMFVTSILGSGLAIVVILLLMIGALGFIRLFFL